MKHRTLIALLGLIVSALPLRADSPLTSTEFWTAYKDVPEVVHASRLMGSIDNATIGAILNEKLSIDKRLAVINALGWHVDGQSNSSRLMEAIRSKHGIQSLDQLEGKGAAETIALFAYMKAMDDYFDVKEALVIADKAYKMKPDNFSINLIRSLIQSQYVMDYDWCKVFTSMKHLKTEKRDGFRQEALKIVFDYIDLYEETC